MIETYAFLAVFTMQTLAMSVLYPARFSRYVRSQASSLPADRLAQLYPSVDLDLARERFLARFRTVNTAIAVLGLLLLGWFVTYTHRQGWQEDPVVVVLSVYFVIQLLPIGFIAWLGFRFNREHRSSLLGAKRRANLQRRGLFDFVSPFSVAVAVSSYFLFTGFVLYIQSEPLPGFALIGVLTFAYAYQAFFVYRALYGKSSNPLDTHAGRLHTVGLTVRVCVYTCILCAAFFTAAFTFDLLDLKRWVPFAQSVCLLITTLFCLGSLTRPPHEPDAEDFNSSPIR